jgi:hypothetical protein
LENIDKPMGGAIAKAAGRGDKMGEAAELEAAA